MSLTATTRVLGVDPGLTRCGFGVVDVHPGRRVELVAAGVIRTPADAELGDRLALLAKGLRTAIETHAPNAVAVERVFAQNNRSTVMGTAQASGVALLVATEAGLPVATHTPSEVKAAVSGYGAADKKQVQNMIARILRLAAAPKPADAADALAIAICHAWRGGGGAGALLEGASAVEISRTAPSTMTPAQQAWKDAEAKSARVGRTYVRASR